MLKYKKLQSRRVKLTLALGLLINFALRVPAMPGDLVEVRFDATLKTGEIDKLALQLFKKNKGEQAPHALYNVDVYWLIFESTDLDKSRTLVTAQLFVPLLPTPQAAPVYLFAPGSTGIISACRPSREHIAGIIWGQYRSHLLAHAAQGSIGILPDYMHFSETDKIQPYLIAEAEGHVLLDALRAAYNFFAPPSRYEPGLVPANEPIRGGLAGYGAKYEVYPLDKAFVSGYSQGGHAAFAAADFHNSYAPDVPLVGVIGYGPSADLVNLLKEFTVISPLLVYVYEQIYGKNQIDPAQILADRWLKSLVFDVKSRCIGSIQTYYSWNPREMYKPAFADALLKGQLEQKYPQILRLLTMNSTGLSGHKLPVLILQGTNDVVVYLKSQTRFVQQICMAGSPVQYVIFKGGRHDTRQLGFTLARDWMAALAAGAPPPDTCS